MQNNKIIVAAITSFILAATIVGISLIPTRLEYVAKPEPVFATIPLPIIEPLATVTVPLKLKQSVPTLDPTLKRICSCESNGNPNGEPRQFNSDGTVLRGKINSNDVGQCQISETYWLDMANKLGYNLETSEGNIRMANYIYEKHGASPWKWSVSCHGVQ